jgi:ParB-like chromosome segregation protein Spo0J
MPRWSAETSWAIATWEKCSAAKFRLLDTILLYAGITHLPLRKTMSNNSIPIEVIPVKLIIPPKGGGKLSDKTLDLLADSMRVDGMLHPLLVRPSTERSGYYHLVAGRHRFYVTSKVLKSETVECRILSDMDDAEARMMALTENVCRTAPKSTLARLTLIAEWAELYTEKYPDKVGRRAGAKARWAGKSNEGQTETATEAVAEEPAETTSDANRAMQLASDGNETSATETEAASVEAVAAKAEPKKRKAKAKPKGGDGTFVEQVAAATGKSKDTIGRDLRITRSFPEDQWTLLLKLGSTQKDLLTILDATPNNVPARNQIVSLVASGQTTEQAIANVLGSESSTESSGEQMTDDQWYMERVYEPFGKYLANDSQFREDAILYRHVIDALGKLHKATKKIQEAAKAKANGGKVGWLFLNLAQLTHLSHPRNWLLCQNCGGRGLVDPGVTCNTCKGACYRLKTEKIG